MTLRMTSPACMARNASFTSSRPIAPAHHVGEVEPAALHQTDEAREVAAHLRRAVHAAEQLLLLVEESEAAAASPASRAVGMPTTTTVPPRRAVRTPG